MPPKIHPPVQAPKRKIEETPSTTVSGSPPHHLPRPKSETAIQIEAIKRAIRKKDDWGNKLKDPIVRERYIEEAIAQGASPEAVKTAIEELEFFETKETTFNFDDIVSNQSIFHVDNLIPSNLQKSLEQHLDVLADKPVKDFHPGSEDKVLDLIHPSLFPYIRGVSLTYDDLKKGKQNKKPEKEEKKGKKLKNYRSEYTDRWGRDIENSDYQWLPAIYSVDKNEKVKITSYINNLDRDEHPEIYEDCEKIFEKLLPTIDKCIIESQHPCNENANVNLEGEEKEEITAESLQGPRTYQVITKACNYVLKPGETYEGNWHIEGMTHERIMVSALYYYSSSPHIEDAGLSFRVDTGYNEEYGPSGEREWTRAEDLGTIRTHQGRCIVFSNEFQHKVAWLENKSKTEVGTRKILCFFVVDPQFPIVSSMDVPPQQWEKTRRKLIYLMLMVFRRRGIARFPKDVVIKIVEYAKIGFTWEEALEHRMALMKERKFFVNAMNQEMEREFSLCEH